MNISDHKPTYLAKANFRNRNTLFGIKQSDRMMHQYLVGKTGTGKSTLLKAQILQDIHSNRGCALVDPHGDLIDSISKHIPNHRNKDLIYLNVPSQIHPFLYNPLKRVNPELRPLLASGILESLENLWSKTTWGQRIEHILRYIVLTLLEQERANFSDILRILHDERYRNKALSNINRTEILNFWKFDFPAYSKSAFLPIQNKIGAFLAYPSIRRTLIENQQEISMRRIMDDGKILLINLSKGSLGTDASNLLGSLLINSLGLASFSRVNIPENERKPFHLYADEFQNFTTRSWVGMFSELRKFKVSLTLANQYMEQITPAIRNAIIGNVGTLISFRVGPNDARLLAKEMEPDFEHTDFINLANYDIYLKLMIDGKPSKPFSATTVRFEEISNQNKL